ncbi:MAG: RluA family pseudouridine synthase [Coprobacter sp.]|nr:RluA family pseudouridine synthase [Coprobacter sp.]
MRNIKKQAPNNRPPKPAKKHDPRRQPGHNDEKSCTVPADGHLLDTLLTLFADRSRSTVKSWLAHRQVAVNDTPTTRYDQPVHAGDKIKINFRVGYKEFKNSQLRIIYEDDALIVVDKVSGLLSVSTDRIKTRTAYHILSNYLKSKDPAARLFVLHRLDRDTSGLMMFAKNQRVQEIMQHAWNEMILDRRYIAVVEGQPHPAEGEITSYLCENAAYEVYSTPDKTSGGQYALTRYRVLQGNRRYSLVELQLATGRKNQIRVHLKDIGHSIAGDRKYGARTNPLRRMALHASRLRFVHPLTRHDMHFEVPPPAPFRQVAHPHPETISATP